MAPQPSIINITSGLDWAEELAKRLAEIGPMLRSCGNPQAQMHVCISGLIQDVQAEVLATDRDTLLRAVYEHEEREREIEALKLTVESLRRTLSAAQLRAKREQLPNAKRHYDGVCAIVSLFTRLSRMRRATSETRFSLLELS